jgi:L-xylulokinase
MSLLLGIDAGTTVTKAVLFAPDGRLVARHAVRVAQSTPAPHHVERDQDAVWDSVIETVREVLAQTGRAAGQIAAIGLTSHGDGIYLVDDAGRPTRPGIMSLDTRAQALVERWADDGTAEAAQPMTGQRPWASAPAALLGWLAEHEPDVLARTRFALPCKDMIRHRLTGEFATEPTEASQSFTNVATQAYDETVLAIYGLTPFARLSAPIVGCADIAGRVHADAARVTGLLEGTPVAGSAHDVDCGAIGTGVRDPGTASVIAGSFNINQVVSLRPCLGSWIARTFAEPGRWLNMSISPTSSTNFEWFTQTLCRSDLADGAATGDPFGFVEAEIAEIAHQPSEVVYLPFLYGSPLPGDASATFLGLRGWHGRGHLLRAVMEGVAMTHRHHIDVLAAGLGVDTVRLTGGATRSARWTQIFADVLNRAVEVTDCPEASALGVAQLAGIAAGVYPDLPAAISATVRVQRRVEPGEGLAAMAAQYERYRDACQALDGYWSTDRKGRSG